MSRAATETGSCAPMLTTFLDIHSLTFISILHYLKSSGSKRCRSFCVYGDCSRDCRLLNSLFALQLAVDGFRSLLSGGPSGGKAVSRVSAKTSSLLAGSPGPNEGCLPQAMSWNMCKGRARGPAPHAYTTKRLSRATSSRTILNSTGLSSRTPVRLGSAIRALQVSARSHTASRARTEPTPTARQ